MKNKAIDQTVNWRNTAKTPEYQKPAAVVNTFVQDKP